LRQTFSGKRIYITGGSSGIGLALAKRLASLGAHILIIARSLQKLEQARTVIDREKRSCDQQLFTMDMDVKDSFQVADKMAVAVKDFGAPDILILSAGINTAADLFDNTSPQAFEHEIAVNVGGVRNPIHALIGPLRRSKGHIVIISSAAALFGMFGYTTYAASKSALTGFAESLRYELTPAGVSVSIVYPPEVDTPMNVKEAKTLPFQARAVKNMSGCLSPEFAARQIITGMLKKKFMIIPGRLTRFLYLLHRLTNGRLTRLVSDAVIKRATKKGGV